jgi:hypothetical protein
MKSFLILAGVLALAAYPAVADSKGKGPAAHGKSTVQAATFCPPGLAKKSPACIPPGQAKKIVPSNGQPVLIRLDGRDYRYGDRLLEPRYHVITRPDLYGLAPLADGSRYVIAGNNLLRVNGDTFALLSLVGLVERILD